MRWRRSRFPRQPPAQLDELFEAAELAEVRGDRDVAASLYDMCARFDRSDAIALYNLGNIRLAEKALDAAVIAYSRALSRDQSFAEARYNLAIALEAAGKETQAREELTRVVKQEPRYPDAVFNLAQLLMKKGDVTEAKSLYERYLSLDPPADFDPSVFGSRRYSVNEWALLARTFDEFVWALAIT